MTARVYITDHHFGRNLKIAIINETVTGERYYAFTQTSVPIEENAESPNDLLTLSEDEGRALYEALARRYGDFPNNPTDLRRDYLEERKRVDKLTESLIETNLAHTKRLYG